MSKVMSSRSDVAVRLERMLGVDDISGPPWAHGTLIDRIFGRSDFGIV